MFSAFLQMSDVDAEVKLDEEEGASTAHGSLAESASSPSSPSSPSGGSPRSCGDAAPEAAVASEPAFASFAQRPSVGTWLLPRPIKSDSAHEAFSSPFDRYLTMIHRPHWAHLYAQRGEDELERELEEVEEPENAGEGELEERLQAEAFPASGPESAPESARQCQALHHRVLAVVRDLSAFASRWDELDEELSDLQVGHSKAAVERARLQERVARLRGILRRARGEKPEEQAEEEATLARATAPQVGRSGGEETSLKLCKRARLQRLLPSMLRRAERFDREGEHLGEQPLDVLAEEAAALAAFRDEAEEELRAMEAEAAEAHRLKAAAHEESRQLECRLRHLRTCVASAKQKAADGKADEEAKVSLAVVRQGGC